MDSLPVGRELLLLLVVAAAAVGSPKVVGPRASGGSMSLCMACGMGRERVIIAWDRSSLGGWSGFGSGTKELVG